MKTTLEEPAVDEIAAAIRQRFPDDPARTEAGEERPGAVLVHGNAAGSRGSVVVAAVDDDTCPGRVLRYAAAEARRRGVPLRVVHVWTGRPTAVPGVRRARLDQMSDADLLLSEVLYDHLTPAQADATEREILHDPDPGRALVALSAEAALLVVAARSTPAGDGDPLGGTVRELLGRTACPLAVLPPDGPAPVRQPRW
ncbi:universal stress protein [Actinoplanes sp. NPDC049599]|uniref:universal stress protein n=1 Tax=Actinoplanes sp. NPDC049599 TaxID=3363903 RepID=UPI00378A78AD